MDGTQLTMDPKIINMNMMSRIEQKKGLSP